MLVRSTIIDYGYSTRSHARPAALQVADAMGDRCEIYELRDAIYIAPVFNINASQVLLVSFLIFEAIVQLSDEKVVDIAMSMLSCILVAYIIFHSLKCHQLLSRISLGVCASLCSSRGSSVQYCSLYEYALLSRTKLN